MAVFVNVTDDSQIEGAIVGVGGHQGSEFDSLTALISLLDTNRGTDAPGQSSSVWSFS